jgi:[protein-PII] uridylyltransferase
MSDFPLESLYQSLKAPIVEGYEQTISELVERLRAEPESRRSVRERALLLDLIITKIRRAGVGQGISFPKMAVLAVGGYGRGELFLHSDIDVMFLVEEGKHAQAEPLVNLILYLLWDMKCKTGHSVRSIGEALQAAHEDMTIRTALMEARRVTGSQKLSREFFARFELDCVEGAESEFIAAKLQERHERHLKFGDSRAILEPNIKNGKGALRDLQTLMWLMRAAYGVRKMGQLQTLGKISKTELAQFRRARRLLHLIRQHLHDSSGNAQEQLTFEAQKEIAERLGYRGDEASPNQAVERFMKRYFQVTRQISHLTRTLCFLLEEEWNKQLPLPLNAKWKQQMLPEGLEITHNRLNFSEGLSLQEHPQLLIDIFWFLHRLEIDIHPAAWQRVTRNLRLIDKDLRKSKPANDRFLQLLLDSCNPAPTLIRMNEAGVLGKFIPDFGRLAGQMQFDLYHTLTVDEHILTGLGYLHQLEAGEMAQAAPLAGPIFSQIESRRTVYLSLLCHDIAKGRGGNHHLKGVVIGRKLARRFGFSLAEIRHVEWLVKHHQHLSMVAFKRDLDDNRVIESFACEVNDLQRLKMLYVMTIADIHAVGPTIWNSWKGSLLEALYRKTERMLTGEIEHAGEESYDQLQQQLERELYQTNPRDIAEYIEGADAVSLESYAVEVHARIFPCWYVVQQKELFGIRFKSYEEQSVTNVTIATPDKRGLFAQISGVFAICGANIRDARIFTRDDGVVIDRFAIQDENGQSFNEDRRQERIQQRLRQVLGGGLNLPEAVAEMEARYPDVHESFHISPQITFDQQASETHTLIELHCLDQRGLLYRITNTLASAGLTIWGAHIATYGEKAVDVFYVQTEAGEKLRDEEAQEQVREMLVEVL